MTEELTLPNDEPIDPTVSAARLQTAAAIRDLIHAFVRADADDVTLQHTETIARAAIAALSPSPPRLRAIPDFADLAALREAGVDLTNHALADRAVAGPANPASVRLDVRREHDEAIADVWFGPAFEGAPGRVHGGLIAAVFDDLTGYALAIVQEPGFTGRLTVNFRAPIPIETTIEFRARIRTRDGRKLLVDADAHLDGQLLASAEALFILVDRDHFLTHGADPRDERRE